jgi:lysozyme
VKKIVLKIGDGSLMTPFLILALFCMITTLYLIYKPNDKSEISSKTQYNGIDVSKHNGEINWKKVSKINQIEFVYVKATEGATHQDSKYQKNFDGAKKAGFNVGSYHYFSTKSPVKAQFDNFVKYAKKNEQDLIPLIDVEEIGRFSKKKLQDSLTEFLTMVEEHYGVKPMIYSGNSFYNDNLAPQFNNYPLMIGKYGKNKPVIKGGGKYTIWQYSDKELITGKFVDLNRYHPIISIENLLLKK